MLKISTHAIHRFKQRASPTALAQLRNNEEIKDYLRNLLKLAHQVTEEEYRYNCTNFVIRDNTLVTIYYDRT